jgi:hypothetical protein
MTIYSDPDRLATKPAIMAATLKQYGFDEPLERLGYAMWKHQAVVYPWRHVKGAKPTIDQLLKRHLPQEVHAAHEHIYDKVGEMDISPLEHQRLIPAIRQRIHDLEAEVLTGPKPKEQA